MTSTTRYPHSSHSPRTDRPPSPNVDENDFPEHEHAEPENSYDSKKYHPYLNGIPCDEHGQDLPPNSPPPSFPPQNENAWAPFEDEVQFRIADFLFQKVEMSQGDINHLMELWNLSMLDHDAFGPFQNHDDMYKAIDEIQLGSAPWKCFICPPDPDLPPSAPDWQCQSYQVWYRDPTVLIANMLANPDFAKEFETTPYIHLGPDGNDKTTVSVATGNVKYHPAYISIGNILNRAWRAHRNAVIPFAFLAIPKSDRKYDNDVQFRNFKCKLYHASLAAILHSLKPGMTTPVVQRCPDGHFRRIIYDLAAYIADYPEQVLLAGVMSGWCVKCTALASDLDKPAGLCSREHTEMLRQEFSQDSGFDVYSSHSDIHEMLTSDLLHQIIKGSFKDHLIEWVGEYLEMTQWTGDDSKALMKVYLAAIADYVDDEIVRTFAAFLDFCYLVRRSDIDENTLFSISEAVGRFQHHRKIFITMGIRDDFNLPCQRAMIHYVQHIIEFGVPNGLCSSITESRHITAVKKPWHCSNRYQALSQMLLTNQQLDKLNALRSELVQSGLIPPTHAPPPDPFETGDEDSGPVDDEHLLAHVYRAQTRERGYPRDIDVLAQHIKQPLLTELTRRFLYEQLYDAPADLIDIDMCPFINSNVYVYHSAVTCFYAPSDISGIRGMHQERVHSMPSWYGHVRHDCDFVVENEDRAGFWGMSVVHILLFFSFVHDGIKYPCALVHWFKKHGQWPDTITGMWIVKPDHRGRDQHPWVSVVHLDSLLHGAHLLPVFGHRSMPLNFHYSYSLDCFQAFYVPVNIDHHANEIVF
ncbi:uncharacterized protein EV420DRAFT_1623156 [Desarmillaria tabescens]|uniref:Uncharacterized protein n=1 Tax=Armillaria tabescens TaxID=1929756 RepID=A0AA39JC07_ARMTA|nr:uncharacterized protein EV420DRAFT_1623156 [Desarmillaria tabescens]KAK0439960.1 hypothetical protein EV420DRAFT_1623156 [Desarmillaria tabescens]